MYFSHSFVLAALPFLAAAIPMAVPPTSRGISIPIVKRNSGVVGPSKFANAVKSSIAKIQRGMAAYEKNTGAPHPLSGGIKPLTKRNTGSDPLTDDSQFLWYGSLSIGTPEKPFTVDFDTGSSDLFVPSSSCDSTCNGHRKYNSSASSTSKDLNKPFMLTYGDGSTVSGEQYTDVVHIAGLTASPQTLGAATQYSGFQSPDFPADGLMGMGFESISSYGARPPFQTLMAEGQVTEPVFGFKLATSGSELYLGGVNKALFKGETTWVPLSNVGYWQAPFDSISVNGKTAVQGTEAIFDTGTTLIIGDPERIELLYLQIPGALPAPEYGVGLYTIPCKFNTPISISVGGREFAISPASFNLGPVSDGSDTCIAGAAEDAAITGEFWILGDVFLQNVYTTWDVGQTRIGFATLA